MRVLLTSHRFWPSVGGTEEVVERLAEQYARGGKRKRPRRWSAKRRMAEPLRVSSAGRPGSSLVKTVTSCPAFA